MSARRILVVGDGRMGRAVAEVAAARGHTVLGPVGRGAAPGAWPAADVAIEFTSPDSAERVVGALLAAGLPVVSGTTGWDEGLARVTAQAAAHGGTLVHAANFSVGVQLLLRGAAALAQAFSTQPAFDAAITETHHAAKRDAPSGTARLLQAAVRAADPARAYPITSLRLGAVPGTHDLCFDGPYEQILLRHEARDRRVFADGAVTAAERLVGRTGILSLPDLLFGPLA